MIIYKLTNLINNKIYIGQTSTSLEKRLQAYGYSDYYIDRAIKKHGRNNFKKEIIVEGDFNQALTNELEKHYIRLYNSTNNKVGYNIENGGNSRGKISEESKKKMSISASKRRASEETKLKMSISQKERLSSPEMKKRLSERMKGNTHSTGFKHTEETKIKRGISISLAWNNLSDKEKKIRIKNRSKPHIKKSKSSK